MDIMMLCFHTTHFTIQASMEESRRVESRRVSFSFNHSLFPSFLNAVKAGAKQGEVDKKKTISGVISKQNSEVPKAPNQALEYLCRSWSPSSSEFFNLLSSSQILVPNPNDEQKNEDDQAPKEQRLPENAAQFSGGFAITTNHTWAWLSSERFTESSIKRQKSYRSNLTSMKVVGELFTRFIIRSQMNRKERQRLETAQVHAALSVARLAAAIAGTVGNLSVDSANDWSVATPGRGEGWDPKMSVVVASAAALVATFCAEAAETVGARRSLVASSISRGLATQSAAEILELTAAAATCLRGASTLEVRTAANRLVSEEKKILVRGLQLSNCPPNGKLQGKKVTIYLKHNSLTLRLEKKLLRGTITTHKEYRITSSLEEIKNGDCLEDDQGLCYIALATNKGTIRLLFEDKLQYLQWKSTISHLLCIKNQIKLITN